MAFETSKALKRRFAEHDAGGFPWRDVFKGKILDVGAGQDPVPGSVDFDVQHGDANELSKYFPPESFSLVHGSHIAEHLHNPEKSLRDWLTLVPRGGYLCITIPDVGAYENFTYPSKYNPDHKASFSMIYRGSMFPVHYHIPTLCESMSDVAETLIARYVEVNFNWKLPRSTDQTWLVENGCEIWNEVLWRRK